MTDTGCVLGVDSGGSGMRVALDRLDGLARPAPVSSKEPVRTGALGMDAEHFMEQLGPLTRELLGQAGGGSIAAVAIGAAGMATLGDDLRAQLPSALRDAFGVRRLALAADAVTAYAGALGDRPGAVVAAGTGMIAIGTDLSGWHRADGWGHLLGDCGGGAWIGRAGLEAAMRAFDGRQGGSKALLALAEELFGPVQQLPGQLYPRPDRPAMLASFAPEVARCADDDPVAAAILRDAARHIAEAAAAVCPASDRAGRGERPEVALTGGLFKMGDALLHPVAAELGDRLRHVRLVPAAGAPLDGAVRIAADVAADRLRLPLDPRMLTLHVQGDAHPRDGS
ncbi:BadF/BadG/BcrA/BcrD ATPase family protein [Streptomyces sp. NPDC059900]|uniref:N-acetylglucosamine kinase n=1 Tax=Streptomyces sp. NPDC059900 TaxID=3155816 RepID=UPI003420737F